MFAVAFMGAFKRKPEEKSTAMRRTVSLRHAFRLRSRIPGEAVLLRLISLEGKVHPVADQLSQQLDKLGDRVGASFRKTVGIQGKAYAEYGALLDQFANRKIEFMDFGRKAIDLYIGAVSDVVSNTADIAGDAVKVGVNKFSKARDKAGDVIADAAKSLSKDGIASDGADRSIKAGISTKESVAKGAVNKGAAIKAAPRKPRVVVAKPVA